MCGIAGMAGGVDEGALRMMTQILHHRGPDDGAIWMDAAAGIGFGHRRLAIIDPAPASRQPMRSHDGRHILTFNGEIFNYRGLRTELEARGRRFRTASDTEVLVEALAEWGDAAIERIEGQFAFAWWDAAERRLLLARDHLGIKPLYYGYSGPKLLFASEIKSLAAADPSFRRMNMRMLPRHLAFLWVPGGDTMFEGVRRLEPGSVLEWRAGDVRIRKYWDPVEAALRAEPNRAQIDVRAAETAAHLRRAVREQLVSDVPLGILLSGGLDSTIILAAATDSGRAPDSFTAGYSAESRAADVFDDDAAYARLAAQRFGSRLHVAELEHDVPALLDDAVWHLDEPLGDPTVVTNLELTRAARGDMTVLLSGMGADEIHAGYPRYPAVMYGGLLSRLPASVPRAAAVLVRGAVRAGVLPQRHARRILLVLSHLHGSVEDRFLGYSTYFDAAHLHALLASDVFDAADIAGIHDVHTALFDRLSGVSPLQRMLAVDLATFLPSLNLENTDKTSMANSVEVRVPFLDRVVVEHALGLPDRDRIRRFRRKVLLRRAFADAVPREILHRRKTGYSPPVRGWVRGLLRRDLRDSLSDFERRGFTRPGAIARLYAENDAGTRDHAVRIWQLHVLELWMRRYIDAFRPARRYPLDTLDVIA